MTEKTRKKYTEEFKRESVGLVTSQGLNISEAARNLGINSGVLGRWVRQRGGERGALFGSGRKSPEQEEIQRLKKENKRLHLEREILKKAAAFFARESS